MKKTRPRLQLCKETIRALAANPLAGAVGGRAVLSTQDACQSANETACLGCYTEGTCPSVTGC